MLLQEKVQRRDRRRPIEGLDRAADPLPHIQNSGWLRQKSAQRETRDRVERSSSAVRCTGGKGRETLAPGGRAPNPLRRPWRESPTDRRWPEAALIFCSRTLF
jgi:hypothetical protein